MYTHTYTHTPVYDTTAEGERESRARGGEPVTYVTISGMHHPQRRERESSHRGVAPGAAQDMLSAREPIRGAQWELLCNSMI